MHVTIQRKIAVQRAWLKIDRGIEITEFVYQGQEWSNSRRMIAVRREVALLLMSVTYNFLSLFKQVIIGGDVRNRLKTLRYRMWLFHPS
jgi:hypothetical protein